MSKSTAIVVVEDRPEDRFFFAHELRKAFPDCTITEFSYGEEALGYLRSPERSRVDLVFVDISMPRMNGFEFADAFDALYPELKQDSRLYMMSSSINPDDHQYAAQHAAISGFLEKPASKEVLQSLIEQSDL